MRVKLLDRMAAVKKCTTETVGKFVKLPQVPELDQYLAEIFAEPRLIDNKLQCLKCDQLATFRWGLQHGEGSCSNCRWPSRGYHFLSDGARFVAILQYHPDIVAWRGKPKPAEVSGSPVTST